MTTEDKKLLNKISREVETAMQVATHLTTTLDWVHHALRPTRVMLGDDGLAPAHLDLNRTEQDKLTLFINSGDIDLGFFNKLYQHYLPYMEYDVAHGKTEEAIRWIRDEVT